jgi:hypothetical protein
MPSEMTPLPLMAHAGTFWPNRSLPPRAHQRGFPGRKPTAPGPLPLAFRRFGMILVMVLPLAGCGGGGGGPATPDASAPAVKSVAANRLEWGDPLPPLDDGRVILSAPKDWAVLPRRRGYLTQFYRDKTQQVRVPRIWVTVEESTLPEIRTVDADNLEQFAQLVAQRLKDNGTKLVEPVRPMMIGDTPCARYVLLTTFSSTERGQTQKLTAERQILEVLAGGRLYTIDLHVPPRKMLDYRDAGYAVAASMSFPKLNDPAAEAPAADVPSDPESPSEPDAPAEPGTPAESGTPSSPPANADGA